MNEKILQTQWLYSILEAEIYIVIFIIFASTWLFYQLFLRNLSEERHKSIRDQIKDILKHFIIFSLFFLTFYMINPNQELGPLAQKALPYVALLTFAWGAMVFVRSTRLLVLFYLFLGAKQEGVPILMVNIFSLLVSMIILFWGAAKIFNVQLGPLLATSAAFSLILGLAMQDTLGNLFAGISLQLDKNYEIGDWIEIQMGSHKAVGKVVEITWRSTLLIGFSEEFITIPNRTMATAQISNYSPVDRPIIRSQIFRVKYGSDLKKVKVLLEKAALTVNDVLNSPEPYSYVQETTESWITFKLGYYIESFGSQHNVADKIVNAVVLAFHENNIEFARPEISVSLNQKI